ncbi:MAG: UDP-N-acetylmuramoyl-tripeptide--D-alanyl-D-alanine ligase [Candidatus Caldarchaeum sp.]
MLELDFVLSATGGKAISSGSASSFTGVSTDSRLIRGGELFFAIQGERYDGHRFVTDALASGALGAVVEKQITLPNCDKAIILVESTRRALGDLAARWREGMQGLKLAAITGSNGKTTTKEMTYSILSQKFKTIKNLGNLNNDIGVPLAIFSLRPFHERAVVELGMNAFGEIRRLTEIAQPDVGAITCVGKAHLEKLGDIEGVARAKAELVENFSMENTFVVNADDPFVETIAKSVNSKKITVGIKGKGLDITARNLSPIDFSAIEFTMDLMGIEFPIRIKGIGLQNVLNALIASGIAYSLGCGKDEIMAGLELYTPTKMRLEVIEAPQGFKVLNDAYNANPDSIRAALVELTRLKGGGKAIAVLGDMLELGTASAKEHRHIGELAGSLGVDILIAYGSYAEEYLMGANEKVCRRLASTHAEAAALLTECASKGDVVLVKGSRGMEMEKIIEKLFEQ